MRYEKSVKKKSLDHLHLYKSKFGSLLRWYLSWFCRSKLSLSTFRSSEFYFGSIWSLTENTRKIPSNFRWAWGLIASILTLITLQTEIGTLLTIIGLISIVITSIEVRKCEIIPISLALISSTVTTVVVRILILKQFLSQRSLFLETVLFWICFHRSRLLKLDFQLVDLL